MITSHWWVTHLHYNILITDNVWQDNIAAALCDLSKATKKGFKKHYSSFQEILNLCDLSMKRLSQVEP
jgi:glutamine synthetase